MGVGKAGFNPQGSGHEWAILVVWKNQAEQNQWWQSLLAQKASVKNFKLQPLFGNGTWSGRDPFAEINAPLTQATKIAVITRASIKWRKAKLFWESVPGVADDLTNKFNPEFTAGMGEIPYIRQATFSVWNNEEEMKRFAYQNNAHKKVIAMTKEHQWYSEDLFYRFAVL